MQTYDVQLALEMSFQNHGPCYVARDDAGHWRAYCPTSKAGTALEAVRAMFHANEIVTVSAEGTRATIDAGDDV